MRRFALLVLFAAAVFAQQKQPLKLQAPIQDKNFYVLSGLERLPASAALTAIAQKRAEAVKHAVDTCKLEIECIAAAFRWNDEQERQAAKALSALYKDSPPVRAWVDGDLRDSGAYVRFQNLAGAELLARAWLQSAAGIDLIIDTYATGKPGRYPAIDSMLYDPKSNSWQRVVQGYASLLAEDPGAPFFQPSLRFALEVMNLNHRDEAGRLEPMESGENKGALEQIKTTDWQRYPYSAIVVPGAGNDRPGVRISAFGKLRDDIAASRFRQGKAPFIIVSGGFVHPSQTEYAEALEMKHDLIARLGIPATAIVVDPHARHTTTNMRNAARLLYRDGMPFEKKALVTSDAGQSQYIEGDVFSKRCITELGYLPYKIVSRTSPFDLEFLPQIDSLQIDPSDPLDP
jgi:hypothetical protein